MLLYCACLGQVDQKIVYFLTVALEDDDKITETNHVASLQVQLLSCVNLSVDTFEY